MLVTTIQEVIKELVAVLPNFLARVRGSRNNCYNREIEELAQSILDYARMVPHPRRSEGVLVEVDELAFRLRETRRTITKVLCLLESQESATRTGLKGVWYLKISPE